MADSGDLASEYMDNFTAGCLANRPKMDGTSLKHCIDCDDEIPELRRAVGGVKRCICCQEIHDTRNGR